MQLILTMPQPGETITEGVVVSWLKKAGDPVAEKEPLVELETEKAVFTYESPFEGQIVSLEAGEGDHLQVGAPLAVFEIADEKAHGYLSLGIGRRVGEAGLSGQGKSVPLSPRLRARIRALGLLESEVLKIGGTGPGGRLTEADIEAFARGHTPAVAADKAGVRRIPVTPVRRRIAANMERSRSEIPHAAAAVEADLTNLVRWKDKHPSETFLPCFVWAVVRAISAVPEVNASWKGDAIEVYDAVHVNLAVATPRGLFVPLLRDAGAKSYSELARETARLAAAATAGTLTPEDLACGTITINNHGAVGSLRAFQVIRHPQAVIIGFGKIVDRPWVLNGAVVPRKISDIDLSFDHRVIDGDLAVKFLESVRKEIEGFSLRNP